MIRAWVSLALCTLGAHAAEVVALSGRAMGTAWSVKFIAPARPVDREEVQRHVTARLEELERQFSTYREDSEITRFNRTSSTEWQPVSPEIARVAAESRRISERSGGAFDATVEPLVRLWGFGAERRRETLPGAEEIAAARGRVGWSQLEIRSAPPALRKQRADLAVDFSSMAKGFASDAVLATLAQLGIENVFVQVGGDIRTNGGGADQSGWRAGIEEPGEHSRRLARVVGLTGQALSTSGDYRNAFVTGGRRYGHIIDPRTGFPVNNGLAAVSVIHATCAESSAWATALFVLGPEEGLRVATREQLACLFTVRAGDRLVAHATPEFERFAR